MSKPPTSRIVDSIKFEYENRARGGVSKGRLWSMIGDLLMVLEALAIDDSMRGRQQEIADGTVKITHGGFAAQVSRTLLAGVIPERRPQKPPTPGPSEWKRMTPEQQSAHFAAVQAYEASLTPEDIAALLAKENEAEAAHRANYSGWKSQFDADAPYVPTR